MRYCSLGSGSKGNATLIHSGDSAVLVDCGFSRKALLERLDRVGFDPADVCALLVTHEHGDHAKGALPVCELLDIPLYTSFGTALKMKWLGHSLVHVIESGISVGIGELTAKPVVVPHDSREPLQFVLENKTGLKVGVLSDLGSITAHILDAYQQCHGLQLEANHDPHLLRSGPYPPSLQARVAGNYGHLSNHQCADLLQRLNWPGLQCVSAGHISEKNNDVGLVRQLLSAALGCAPESVCLLEQERPSVWFELR